MEARETVRKIAALPPEAQAVIFDLIAALERRYSTLATKAAKPGKQMTDLKDDPFIGMWRDRADMSDAAAYVRGLRKTEWNRGAKQA
jgi:hypothetical protein